MGHCDCQFRRQRWRLAAEEHTEGAWMERRRCSARAGTLVNQGVFFGHAELRAAHLHALISHTFCPLFTSAARGHVPFLSP